MKRVAILDIEIDALTEEEALTAFSKLVEDGGFHYIFTPNPEIVMRAREDERFREIINRADLKLPDGAGLIWAAHFLSGKYKNRLSIFWHWFWGLILTPLFLSRWKIIPERITGVDFMDLVCKEAEKKAWRVAFVGGRGGVATKTAVFFRLRYPKLEVVEATAGPPYEAKDELIRKLKISAPQVIFVALPYAAYADFAEEMSKALNRGVLVGVGGAFDFYVGEVSLEDPTGRYPARRAPHFMRRFGLEWLWRLLMQPWRARRVRQATWAFAKEVLKRKIGKSKEEVS